MVLKVSLGNMDKEKNLSEEKKAVTAQLVTPDMVLTMFGAHDIWSFAESVLGKKRERVWRFVITLYLLNQVRWWLNFANRVFSFAEEKGIKLFRVERVEPLEDGFRLIVDVHISDLDFRKIRKKWRRLVRKARMLDPYIVKILDPAFKRLIMSTFWELEKLEQIEEMQEYKVVKEEPVNEGEST
jgi:hypothetical protein